MRKCSISIKLSMECHKYSYNKSMECKNAEKLKYIFGIFNKILIEIQDIVCYNTEKKQKVVFLQMDKDIYCEHKSENKENMFQKNGEQI